MKPSQDLSRRGVGATLSVCLIVKNEEAVLAGCLSDAVRFADELIVVDTGSQDRTKEIAHQFTEKVFDFAWCDDFSAARNASFARASCDYVMWLDADDRISAENVEKIIQLKQTLSAKLVYAGYDRPEEGVEYGCLRIVKRDAGFIWKGIVHERLELPDGAEHPAESEILTADFMIKHSKLTELDYLRNIKLMERLTPEELHESFWLCANCYVDCARAGEKEKAAYFLRQAEESTTPFEERLNMYGLINAVLKHHRKMDAILEWNVMYLRCKKSSRPYRRES